MARSKKFLAPTAALIVGLLQSGVAQSSVQSSLEEHKGVATNAVKIAKELSVSADLSNLVLTKSNEAGVMFAGHRSHRSHSSHRSHYSGR